MQCMMMNNGGGVDILAEEDEEGGQDGDLPCFLHMDSLNMHATATVCKTIAHYLWHEWDTRMRRTVSSDAPHDDAAADSAGQAKASNSAREGCSDGLQSSPELCIQTEAEPLNRENEQGELPETDERLNDKEQQHKDKSNGSVHSVKKSYAKKSPVKVNPLARFDSTNRFVKCEVRTSP